MKGMIRICRSGVIGVTLSDKKSTKQLKKSLGIESVPDELTHDRFKWLGHVKRKKDSAGGKVF